MRSTTRRNARHIGRHRVDVPGTVHCLQFPAVAAALAVHHRNWFTALVRPARHSLAAFRKRYVSSTSPHWIPAPATS
ncbi:hypothetical protein [Aldersonia kunmingensis]|uniref:hypothetical protein n=1 Tax=Aldersonia kunmingensis TaxID=408066 RepID=UPI00082FAA7A|nr:hypothetical protein [Aldersonia kunmingensis]